MPTDTERKERAASYLKRVSEIAASTTKTAIIGLGALAIIWLTQIRPQYNQLQSEVYPRLGKSYTQEIRDQKRLERFRQMSGFSPAGATIASPFSAETREEKITGNKTIDALGKEISKKDSEQKKLVESVAFDVFGLKLPVPPLYASAVWNLVLLTLIIYLAQARLTIWTLSANALFALKNLKERPTSLDDIAGSGPLWLAPSPSRPGNIDVTIEELRSAFGWNRLHTLPSIVTTIGFLLLGLLQLAVTAQGIKVIRTAREFTNDFTKVRALGMKRANAASLDQIGVDPQLADLLLSPVEAALLSLFLVLTLVATIAIVGWWFRPWSVPGPLADATATPRRFAIAFLSVATIIFLCLVVAWLKPEWGWRMGDRLDSVLPAVTRILASSMIVFCLVELIALAIQPIQRPSRLNEDG